MGGANAQAAFNREAFPGQGAPQGVPFQNMQAAAPQEATPQPMGGPMQNGFPGQGQFPGQGGPFSAGMPGQVPTNFPGQVPSAFPGQAQGFPMEWPPRMPQLGWRR